MQGLLGLGQGVLTMAHVAARACNKCQAFLCAKANENFGKLASNLCRARWRNSAALSALVTASFRPHALLRIASAALPVVQGVGGSR